MSKLTGKGWEVVFISPEKAEGDKSLCFMYPAILIDGTPVGLLNEFKIEYDNTFHGLKLTASRILVGDIFRNMTQLEYEAEMEALKAKKEETPKPSEWKPFENPKG